MEIGLGCRGAAGKRDEERDERDAIRGAGICLARVGPSFQCSPQQMARDNCRNHFEIVECRRKASFPTAGAAYPFDWYRRADAPTSQPTRNE